MLKITVKADGMMCRMCESHANGAVRKAFEVRKATSSHGKGETVIRRCHGMRGQGGVEGTPREEGPVPSIDGAQNRRGETSRAVTQTQVHGERFTTPVRLRLMRWIKRANTQVPGVAAAKAKDPVAPTVTVWSHK